MIAFLSYAALFETGFIAAFIVLSCRRCRRERLPPSCLLRLYVQLLRELSQTALRATLRLWQNLRPAFIRTAENENRNSTWMHELLSGANARERARPQWRPLVPPYPVELRLR